MGSLEFINSKGQDEFKIKKIVSKLNKLQTSRFKMPSIKLQSSDGKTFPIDLKIAKLSVTIKTMFEDLGMDLENDSNEAVPLTNVTAVVLEKVIEWAENHITEANVKVVPTDRITWYPLSDFNKKFFQSLDQQMLFDIILAANYLDIEDLLALGTKTIADSIKACKDADEIRKKFNVENDFTEEELEQVKKENEWAEEKQ